MHLANPRLYEVFKEHMTPHLEMHSGSAACYIIFKEDRSREYGASVCYGGMSSADRGASHLVIGITNHEVVGEKLLSKFLDLVINHSIYSKIFLTHDIEQIMKDRFFVVDANHSARFIMSALILTRLYRESPQCVEKIITLVEHGVETMLAIYIGHLCVERNSLITLENQIGSHHSVDKHWTIGAIRNYVEGKVADPGHTFSHSPRYSYVVGQFQIGASGAHFVELLKTYLKKSKVETKYVHPFPRLSHTLGSGGATAFCLPREEFFSRVAEIQKELLL